MELRTLGKNQNIMEIEKINQELRDKSPEQIVAWALSIAKKPVVTTNFRPYESAILHLTSKQQAQIPVIWCDTGYNTPSTYRYAKDLIQSLKLNLKLYVPKQSVGFRNVCLGVPEIDTPLHKEFTEQVKLEPFARAMQEHKPDVWFTNLRKGQTAFRDSIGIVSQAEDGLLKVSPFYNYSDTDLDAYLEEHKLPNEKRYYDPTKALDDRECGLHH